MKTVYHSKIGLELLIPLILVFAALLCLMMRGKPDWIGMAILSPFMLMAAHMFLTTHYTIEGDQLKVKCGFIFNKNIDIKTITKISETNNAISAPATSLDRLEISYAKYESLIISPKNKQAFIAHIISLNANVEFQVKKG